MVAAFAYCASMLPAVPMLVLACYEVGATHADRQPRAASPAAPHSATTMMPCVCSTATASCDSGCGGYTLHLSSVSCMPSVSRPVVDVAATVVRLHAQPVVAVVQVADDREDAGAGGALARRRSTRRAWLARARRQRWDPPAPRPRAARWITSGWLRVPRKTVGVYAAYRYR
jgi:hypothetical protein